MILPTCHPFCRRSAAFQPALRRLCERLARDGGGRARGQGALGRPVPTSPRKMGEIVGVAEIKPAALQVRGRFGSFPWVISAETSANLRLPSLANGLSGDGRSLRSEATALRLTAASKAPILRGAPGAAWRPWRRGYGDLSFVARRGCGSCCAWLRRAHSLVANDPSARHRFPSNELRRWSHVL